MIWMWVANEQVGDVMEKYGISGRYWSREELVVLNMEWELAVDNDGLGRKMLISIHSQGWERK